MKYTSIIEKLGCIFKLITSNAIYPIFLIVLIALTILLLTKKLKNKKAIILMIISYLVMFVILIATNYNSLGKVFDSISTNFFTNIYFPSTYTYLFTLVVIDIITLKSMLNKKENKAYKIANGICFFIIQFIFILIMDTVAHNNIDIFSKKSLFSNTNLVILLESSINVFIIWLISLFVIYSSNKGYELMTIRKTNNELDTKPVEIPNTLVVENTITETPETKPAKIPENVISFNDLLEEKPIEVSTIETKPTETTPNIISDTFSLEDLIFKNNDSVITNNKSLTTPIEEIKTPENDLLDKLLNNGLPIITNNEPEKIIETIEEPKNNYTLNDYRIFNKILKDIRETNHSNIISIDKNLELKLISKYSEKEYNLFKGMLKNYSN